MESAAINLMHRNLIANSEYYKKYYCFFDEKYLNFMDHPGNNVIFFRPICNYYLNSAIFKHPEFDIITNKWNLYKNDLFFMIYSILKGTDSLPKRIFMLYFLPLVPIIPDNTTYNNCSKDPMKKINSALWELIKKYLNERNCFLRRDLYRNNYSFFVTDEGKLFIEAYKFLYPEQAKYIQDKLVEVKLTHCGDN